MQNNSSAKKILIIEDEVFISELYTRALNRAGYQTDCIIDGVKALKKAQDVNNITFSTVFNGVVNDI